MRLRFKQVFWVAAVLAAHALLAEGKGKDYYSILGLRKNADDRAIKKAYRWEKSAVTSLSARMKRTHSRSSNLLYE